MNRRNAFKTAQQKKAKRAKSKHPAGQKTNLDPYPRNFFDKAVRITIKAGQTLFLPANWVNFLYIS